MGWVAGSPDSQNMGSGEVGGGTDSPDSQEALGMVGSCMLL